MLTLFCISTETNSLKSTNEIQIDVLKSDIKRLQDEIQTITKVCFSIFQKNVFFKLK